MAGTAKAQDVHHLDLETSIELAKQQSNNMLILKEQLKGASYNLKAATSQFKTHINVDVTMPQYTETIRQWEDSTGISFYPVRQNQMNSYLNINQPLPTDGYLYIRSGIQNFIDFILQFFMNFNQFCFCVHMVFLKQLEYQSQPFLNFFLPVFVKVYFMAFVFYFLANVR